MDRSTHVPRGSKKVAKLRDDPGAGALCVDNDDDWATMEQLDKGELVCPMKDCSAPFTTPLVSSHGVRFLRHMSMQGCGHEPARRAGGGGRLTEEHELVQSHVLSICHELGRDARLEYTVPNGDAWLTWDVYVVDRGFGIEIERVRDSEAWNDTDPEHTLWLIPQSVAAHDAEQALSTLPAVRVRVDAKGRRHGPLRPRKEDHAPADDSQLSVTATVPSLDRERMTVSCKGWMDGHEFLKQVLAGKRRWHAPGTLVAPWPAGGAWVLDDDLEFFEAHTRSGDAADERSAHSNAHERDDIPVQHESFWRRLIRDKHQ